MMNWIKVENIEESKYREQLLNLVKPQEISYIDVASVLAGNKKNPKPIIIHLYGNTVDAALFFTHYGRIIPVMDSNFFFHYGDVELISKLAGNSIFLPTSVYGKADAVEKFLEQFSCGQHRKVLEHYIMELDMANFKMPQISKNLKIRILRGSTRQLLPLFPLQKTYERQEVLLNPDTQDSIDTFLWLKAILTKEICFYAKRGFRYVSKANTNGEGFDHIQIGGVFTVNKFRHQGYALHTVAALCRCIIEEKHKHPSLFVRCDNENAIKLYKTLGFEIKDTVRTVYLE